MKLTIILLTVAIVNVSAKGLSQTVSFNGKNVPLQEVLSTVKLQTGFAIFCNAELFDKANTVTLKVTNVPLKEFLQQVFKGQPLDYAIENTTIFVSEKSGIAAEDLKSMTTILAVSPIRGRVLDAEGRPLAGATVTLKGSKVLGITDAEGMFNVNVSLGDVLVISSVGFESTNYKISSAIIDQPAASGTGISFTITLKRRESQLEEIVINKGYYTESKRLSTGNVSKVTAQDIEKQPVINPLQALQGRMPGVEIVQQSGVPGVGMKIRIRGQNSIRPEANVPLYIIDGVPFPSTPMTSYGELFGSLGTDPLNTINPANIQSIEILKDADATAIYGSRGANGVVLITTKRGKKGKTGLDLNVYSGAGKVSNKMDLLNTQQYLQMRNEAFQNDGTAPSIFSDPDLLLWDTTRYTDWQKKLIGGTSSVTDMQASISGGNEQTSFRFGGGFHKETTVFPGDFGYKRITGDFNLNHASSDQKFKASISINYGIDENRLFNSSIVTDALKLPPNAPALYDEEGNLNWELDQFGSPTFQNPMAALKNTQNIKSHNLIGSANLSYEVFPHFILKTNLGYTDFRQEEIINFPKSAMSPIYNFLPSASRFLDNTNNSWIIEPQLIYSNTFGDSHLDIQAGMTWQDNMRIRKGIDAKGYLSDELVGNLSAAHDVTLLEYVQNQYKYNALFGRIGYSWKEKYLLNLTGRRDGSSRFGPGRQFANFGAAGAAWIFSQESFVKESLPFLSFGKLRASYGSTGSDQIPDYGYLDTYNAITNPSNYRGSGGLYPNQLANPNYGWETNRKLEAGLELGFVNDRVLFSASWYRNRSSNQLVGYRLPAIAGFTSIQYNLPATVQNTGLELELRTTNIQSHNFSWTSSINLTVPKNKLIKYPNIEGSSYASVYKVGESLNITRLFQFKEVDPVTGTYRIVDVNNDGIFSQEDMVAIENLGRPYYGGFSNTIQYKDFKLDFFVEFVKQKGYRYFSIFGPAGFSPSFSGNQPVEVLERWQKAGDITDVQKFTQSFSNYYPFYYANSSNLNIVDASFIRLKTISLSYQFPFKWIEKIKIKECNLYVQAQNLITLTHFVGLDPQTQGSTALPALKMITGGIRFKF